MESYGSLAFSEASKLLQETYGSRKAYARLEQESFIEGLTQNETEFISAMDSFFLSTIGANGYPYLQYRGGPAGFLKVLDSKTIAFADFRGNKQYISTGNLKTNSKVAIMLIDFASQTRLKILAQGFSVEKHEDRELIMQLMPTSTKLHRSGL